MLLASNNLSEATTGKAVCILHVAGDELWSLGSKRTTPQLEDSTPVAETGPGDTPDEGEGSERTHELTKSPPTESTLIGTDDSSSKLTPEGNDTSSATE